MGLPKAVKAHSENNLVEAETHYKRALDQNVTPPVLFQNYGSLLASSGKYELAFQIYSQGLHLHPNNHLILRNFANLTRSKDPTRSIAMYLRYLELITADKDKYSENLYQQVISDVSDILISLDLFSWSFEVLREGVLSTGLSPGFLKNLLLLSESSEDVTHPYSNFIISEALFDQLLEINCTPMQQLVLHFSLAFHRFKQFDYISALRSYQLGCDLFFASYHIFADDFDKALKLMNDNSWNFSCLKLNLADFDGWRLFDYGLRASAPGKQCWQRALIKPFSVQDIPVWRGESLKGKSLFVMEEQAVGDAMMFLSCLPDLLPQLHHLTLFLCKRLAPIYQRTFKDLIANGKVRICTKNDIVNNTLCADNYNYQSAAGSIIQYLYSSFDDLISRPLKIYPNPKLSEKLRAKYLVEAESAPSKNFVVGISWRGGGNPSRSKEKSIDVDIFSSIMSSCSNIKYVSLQYGKCSSQCDLWSKSGLDLIYDSDINPLRDMDSWLAQVDACDAVLSVANTTIHGAGGLNKPTLCLLSKFPDWRWFYDYRIKRSYWYPSVGIARQRSDGDWSQAIADATQWITSGCPYPTGPQWL